MKKIKNLKRKIIVAVIGLSLVVGSFLLSSNSGSSFSTATCAAWGGSLGR